MQRDNYGMTEAMRRIVAYGLNNINALQDGNNGWYSAENRQNDGHTASCLAGVRRLYYRRRDKLVLSSGIDNDVDRMVNLAYNGSVVRSYYAELKDRLLRSEIVPSFAGKTATAAMHGNRFAVCKR